MKWARSTLEGTILLDWCQKMHGERKEWLLPRLEIALLRSLVSSPKGSDRTKIYAEVELGLTHGYGILERKNLAKLTSLPVLAIAGLLDIVTQRRFGERKETDLSDSRALAEVDSCYDGGGGGGGGLMQQELYKTLITLRDESKRALQRELFSSPSGRKRLLALERKLRAFPRCRGDSVFNPSFRGTQTDTKTYFLEVLNAARFLMRKAPNYLSRKSSLDHETETLSLECMEKANDLFASVNFSKKFLNHVKRSLPSESPKIRHYYGRLYSVINVLAQRNDGLVHSYVGNVFGSKCADYDDHLQNGRIELLRAEELYSLEANVQFSTYAMWWIRQAILRQNQRTSHLVAIPVHVEEQLKKYTYEEDRAIQKSRGIRPTPEIVARRVKLTSSQLANLKKVLRTKTLSMNRLVNGKEQDGTEAGSFLGTFTPELIDGPLHVAEFREKVRDVLEILDDRSLRILSLRLGLGMMRDKSGNIVDQPNEIGVALTLNAIGDRYGVSREAVRHIETDAHKKLTNMYHPYVLKFKIYLISISNDNSAVSTLKETLQRRMYHDPVLDQCLQSLQISAKVQQALARDGIYLVGDLLASSREELLSIYRVGASVLNEIAQVLERHRLSLSTEPTSSTP